jgi:hypothetical protein
MKPIQEFFLAQVWRLLKKVAMSVEAGIQLMH